MMWLTKPGGTNIVYSRQTALAEENPKQLTLFHHQSIDVGFAFL
jgi:hypothetical protein